MTDERMAELRKEAAKPIVNGEGWYCCNCGENLTECLDWIKALKEDRDTWQRRYKELAKVAAPHGCTHDDILDSAGERRRELPVGSKIESEGE